MADSRIAVVPPGQGTPVKLREAEVRIKSSVQSSAGLMTCVETDDPPGFVAPPHMHHASTEAFYVLEGTYNFRADEDERSCPTGSFVFVPRGAVHGYRAGERGGRLLIVYLPAGIDEMWQEMEAATGAGEPLHRSQRDAIGQKYQVEWVDETK